MIPVLSTSIEEAVPIVPQVVTGKVPNRATEKNLDNHIWRATIVGKQYEHELMPVKKGFYVEDMCSLYPQHPRVELILRDDRLHDYGIH